MCWLIGCLALSNDEITSYDQRFQLRGDQKTSPQIVLITIKQSDFAMIYDARTNFLDNMSEVTDITDSFFWNKPPLVRTAFAYPAPKSPVCGRDPVLWR
ncbi:hypothetical protein [Bdellovibrio bacteriovorus]|uniref:hypothetical protein n=1 Tax=Bdellovibrio bacteriovorus TaxID=959 RepID=UPI0035A730BA